MAEKNRTNDIEAFVKPSFWECDQCGRNLKHGEFRYNCTICQDYDQCETCATTTQPAHEHPLVRDIAYGYVEELASAQDNLQKRIKDAIVTYRDRYCFGMRDIDENNPGQYLHSYSWQTFKTIGERIMNFGHGLRRFIKPHDYVAICAANRPEWLVTDLACMIHGFISVPIYCLFTDREITFILKNTPISLLVCDKEMLPRFIRLHSECSSLRHIVCMDALPETTSKINDMATIERYGSMKRYDFPETQPEDCITVIYTSGSSGFPKGVMISERALRNKYPIYNNSFRHHYVKLCYRPLAWATDRQGTIGIFLAGGRTGFSSGDVTRLMEDLALVRPTSFAGPPTIWNKIYSEYQATRSLMVEKQPTADLSILESNLLQQYAKLIPIRCTALYVGGAMMSPTVLDFIKRCFTHCDVTESYGSTECGAISYDNLIDVGLHYRLESVTEMGYTLEDQPFPRGELLVHNETMFSGYFNNPEETKAALTEDGYFRTGDVVELRQTSDEKPKLHVIDRKKNFFKLSQGQFVSPTFLEDIYIQSLFVEQIYIHGNALEDSVVAVIIPNLESTRALANKHNYAEIDNDEFRQFLNQIILEDLRFLAAKESLRKHEIPSRILIDFEPFTPENGLLTSSMKPCRYRLAARYSDRLKPIQTVENRLKNLIEKVTGRPLSEDQSGSLISIGGDSLAAVRLSRLIQEELGVVIPLNVLFTSNTSVERLVNLIENPSEIQSLSDTVIPRLLTDSMEELHIQIDGKKNERNPPLKIFLTGTTGFVGAFLLAELLSAYSTPDCQLICLVRCDASVDPLDRIRENLTFLQLWNEDFRHRIQALRGDLAQKRFGLDDRIYSQLADQTDLIFHCGAIVNFVLPYDQLYGANVIGTREIIRFATHTKICIPVHYISTMSVVSRTTIDEISLDHLRTGYAQSKWVAEKLIAKAQHLGLPVVIYRLGSIWGHSETGACNKHDIHTLLLAAMMEIGCYPITSLNTNLTGLPADLAARSIVSLSRLQLNGEKIYHIVQSNAGVSFKNIIESIQMCGVPLISVSYDQWKNKLKTQSTTKHPFESIGEFFSNNPFERLGIHNSPTNTLPLLTFPPIDQDYLTNWVTFILKYIVH